MTSAERSAARPPRRLDDGEIADLRQPCEALIGFVPPRIVVRTELEARLDPGLVRLQEASKHAGRSRAGEP